MPSWLSGLAGFVPPTRLGRIMRAFCPLRSRPPVLETSLLRQVMGAPGPTALVPSVTQGGCRTCLSMYLSHPGPSGWMVTPLHGPAFLS